MEELIPPMVEYARTLKDHGVKLLIRVDVPRWKLGPKEMPTDEDKARTRAWLEPIVRALSPYVDHWQYHNEPNYPDPRHTTPKTPPEVYVAYLALVGEIIREIQPDAVISGPALVMLQAMDEKPYPWLRLAFEAGLAEHIDQFSYHPYRMPWTADILPERASEFFGKWGSYYSQVADLKAMIRKYNDGEDLPLIITEDGLGTNITGEGEQHITWIINAKYDLRRALNDNWLGVNPRANFILYRDLPDQHYELQAAFNMVTRDMDKKPAYFAAQNLHAVLDGTYKRNDEIAVNIELDTPPEKGTAKLIRTEADAVGMKPGGMEGLYVQTYTKKHKDFDELLVFFWAAEQADDTHSRRKATLTLGDPTWSAPLEINLMAMPDPRLAKKQAERDDLINPENPERVQPKPLNYRIENGAIVVPEIEVRDYPMLIKWVRPHPRGGGGE